MKGFHFRICTPQGSVFDEEITSLVLPTEDGEIGFLCGREHTILDLEEGVLRLKTADGKPHAFFVGAGVAEVTESAVSILTGEAYPADRVDEGKQAREAALLRERKRQEQSAVDYKLTKVALSRALEKLKRKTND